MKITSYLLDKSKPGRVIVVPGKETEQLIFSIQMFQKLLESVPHAIKTGWQKESFCTFFYILKKIPLNIQ